MRPNDSRASVLHYTASHKFDENYEGAEISEMRMLTTLIFNILLRSVLKFG